MEADGVFSFSYLVSSAVRGRVACTRQKRFDELTAARAEATTVHVEWLARVAAWRRLDTLAAAERLRGQHIWRNEIIAKRTEWGHAAGIHALAVRVFRLAAPVELPMRHEYGGCKSWIELEVDIPTDQARPVLNDAAFATKLVQFEHP